MRVLIFDPFAGISGDMMLGALIDLGLGEDWLREFVASLDLGVIGVGVERVRRCDIACVKVSFELPPDRAHRHLRDVIEIISASGASETAKLRATHAFERLATAEAEVHGTTIDRVHFHEVGALDSILDVLGAMAGVEELGFEQFFTRPVAVGSGWIDMEHGRYPVPAPAALKVLEGLELAGFELPGECTTPTGAAILATLTEGKRTPTSVIAQRTGFGAGSNDPKDRPNCLRLIAGEMAEAADPLHLVQTDIDDMVPEYAPAAQEALLAAGALDVVVSNVTMKKGRPGLRLEALVPAHALEAVIETLFRATPTIGARHWPVLRPALPREEDVVEWRGQRIRRKRVRLPGGTERTKAEYEDVLRAAHALGMTPYEVRQALDEDATAH